MSEDHKNKQPKKRQPKKQEDLIIEIEDAIIEEPVLNTDFVIEEQIEVEVIDDKIEVKEQIVYRKKTIMDKINTNTIIKYKNDIVGYGTDKIYIVNDRISINDKLYHIKLLTFENN